MANVAAPDQRGWLGPAFLAVAVITLARILALLVNRTDLFVDEAQYWLWGQDLAFGYYSKPPMIGWVIRAATELGGSDAAFWIRLPAPILHGATALLLGASAAHLFGRNAGIVTALGFVTLPIVALGSLVISTDTVLFPFLAASLYAYLRHLERPHPRWALLTGVTLGLGFLSKYAAFYFLIGGALAALLIPAARPRQVLLILAAFLLTISPNIVWNALNGFSTAEHTLDNADWVRDPSARITLDYLGALEFVASQFAAFGPVLMGALVASVVWARGHPRGTLLAFAVPALVLVTIQALLSRANANWAAVSFLSASVLVLPWLLDRPRWLTASFVFNGAMCLLLPLGAAVAPELKRGDRELLARYLGRDEMSEAILQAAETAGTETIVARHRSVLADLFHTGRDQPYTIRALAPAGRAPHHYALSFPYLSSPAPVLYVSFNDPPPCAFEVREVLEPQDGAYRGKTITLYRVPGTCWD